MASMLAASTRRRRVIRSARSSAARSQTASDAFSNAARSNVYWLCVRTSVSILAGVRFVISESRKHLM